MLINPRKGYLHEINVVPFVDVMLVLLIIFMVTAPMLTQGVEVDLPQTTSVETLPEDSDVMIITIHKDGKIMLDTYQVDEADLEHQLKTHVLEKKKLLYLEADKQVPYGTVVNIMTQIKAAGIERLGVVAELEEN
jgi:biopolymer transport protein TolR